MALTTVQLYVVEVFISGVLYGIYCVLFATVPYILISRRPISREHVIIFAMAILMFFLTTADHVLLIVQAMKSRMIPQLEQIATALANIHVFLGDSIIVWRVWRVWSRNHWIAMFPSLILLTSTALGFYSTAAITMEGLHATIAPTAILSAANTVVCTCLIIGRLWYVQRKTAKLLGSNGFSSSTNTYNGIMLLLIESGALYTITMVASVVLLEVKSQGLKVVLNMNTAIIGILPTLIIVLVHFDMVPGTRVNEIYAETLTRKAQMAVGVAVTRSSCACDGNPCGDLAVISLEIMPRHEGKKSLEEWRVHTGTRASEIDVNKTNISDSQV